MGKINDAVLNGHLKQFPEEEPMTRRFTQGFDVNWARRRKAHNTELSCYILGPEACMKQTFRFDFEISLF